MKPVSRKTLPSTNFSDASLTSNFGKNKTIARIQGTTQKLGEEYKNATVVLFNKLNMRPLATRQPDEHGNYLFLGLNVNLKCFIVAFDQKRQYNAVIQDEVVPK